MSVPIPAKLKPAVIHLLVKDDNGKILSDVSGVLQAAGNGRIPVPGEEAKTGRAVTVRNRLVVACDKTITRLPEHSTDEPRAVSCQKCIATQEWLDEYLTRNQSAFETEAEAREFLESQGYKLCPANV